MVDPIAFTVGTWKVHWYGIMAACGFLAAVAMMQKLRHYAGLSRDNIFDISLITMIAGILGARILYVIQFHDYYNSFWDIFRIDQGGLVFYGGFILAVISLMVYCRIKKFSIIAVMDMYAPALAIGHAFGRVGCFLNGCCYGKACDLPWAVVYNQGTEPGRRFPGQGIHPVQLYEVILNLILCVILLFCLKKLKKGQTAAVYFTAYGLLRFVDEFFRGDHRSLFAGVLTQAQVIGLVMIPLGIAVFIYFGRRADVGKV